MLEKRYSDGLAVVKVCVQTILQWNLDLTNLYIAKSSV